MELFLQFGHGMMEHSRHLIRTWGGGTVVLSPRDLSEEQLPRLASDIIGLPNGKVLIDPQFYLPHADHERLCSHDFWPTDYETSIFWQGPALSSLLNRLKDLNERLSCAAFVLPGVLATQVDDDWLETQRAVLEEASSLETDLPLIMTLALSADAARDQSQVAHLLESTAKWSPAGYYLVTEHPSGDYLVQDPNWLANVLDICSGLRLSGATVILGYCNHQLLVAACAKAHAICSGTWMNVRSFPPEKFRVDSEEEIRQRATWYYCPQAQSEYKIPFLDIAQRQGILNNLAPPPAVDGGYSTTLFSGPQPSSIGFTEQAAFRHYLHALHCQTHTAEQDSFDTTVQAHYALLDSTENILGALHSAGVRGQMRDFLNAIDVNRAALSVLESTRGPILRRDWASLPDICV